MPGAATGSAGILPAPPRWPHRVGWGMARGSGAQPAPLAPAHRRETPTQAPLAALDGAELLGGCEAEACPCPGAVSRNEPRSLPAVARPHGPAAPLPAAQSGWLGGQGLSRREGARQTLAQTGVCKAWARARAAQSGRGLCGASCRPSLTPWHGGCCCPGGCWCQSLQAGPPRPWAARAAVSLPGYI